MIDLSMAVISSNSARLNMFHSVLLFLSLLLHLLCSDLLCDAIFFLFLYIISCFALLFVFLSFSRYFSHLSVDQILSLIPQFSLSFATFFTMEAAMPAVPIDPLGFEKVHASMYHVEPVALPSSPVCPAASSAASNLYKPTHGTPAKLQGSHKKLKRRKNVLWTPSQSALVKIPSFWLIARAKAALLRSTFYQGHLWVMAGKGSCSPGCTARQAALGSVFSDWVCFLVKHGVSSVAI